MDIANAEKEKRKKESAGYGAFQYDKEWIEKGFSVSLFSLLLEEGFYR